MVQSVLVNFADLLKSASKQVVGVHRDAVASDPDPATEGRVTIRFDACGIYNVVDVEIRNITKVCKLIDERNVDRAVRVFQKLYGFGMFRVAYRYHSREDSGVEGMSSYS